MQETQLNKVITFLRYIAVTSGTKSTYVLVRECVDKLGLAARQVRLPLEHLHGRVDFVLLEIELREGRDGGFALRIDGESFVTAVLGGFDVLLPLVQSETLVHDRERVDRWGPAESGMRTC